jgi:hypothetical protein
MAEVLRERLIDLETLEASGAAPEDAISRLAYVRKLLVRPKIRDTIFVHANSSGWRWDLQPFLCLGAGAAGAL